MTTGTCEWSNQPSQMQLTMHPASTVNKGAIAGGTVGGVCGLALICGAVFYWYKRKRKCAIRVRGRDIEADGTIEPYLGKPDIDPTLTPGVLSPYAESSSSHSEKTRPTLPARVYNGEVIDIRADNVLQSKPAHGELKDQVDDLKRQVANLRSVLSAGASDALQSTVALISPPDMAHRRRELADYEKLRGQLEALDRRRGSERDTMGADPPPAYDH